MQTDIDSSVSFAQRAELSVMQMLLYGTLILSALGNPLHQMSYKLAFCAEISFYFIKFFGINMGVDTRNMISKSLIKVNLQKGLLERGSILLDKNFSDVLITKKALSIPLFCIYNYFARLPILHVTLPS